MKLLGNEEKKISWMTKLIFSSQRGCVYYKNFGQLYGVSQIVERMVPAV